MLFCETAGESAQDAEDLAVLASQLAACGLDAVVAAGSVPPGLLRNARFDLAPFLTDAQPGEGDRVLVTAAERLKDGRLLALRRLAQGGPVASAAVGAFGSRQAAIGVQARLAYVFGREPAIADLGPPRQGEAGNPVFGVPGPPVPAPDRPRLLLVAPALVEAAEARALIALALSLRVAVAVLTDGEQKQAWIDAHGTAIPVFHYGEVLPLALARRTDLCAVFAPLATSYRARCLSANLIARGAALIDGTHGHAIAAEWDAAVPGPPDIAGLMPFLAERILPNLAAIEAQTRASAAAAALDARAALAALGLAAPEAPAIEAAERPADPARPASRRRVVFMPTNGIGLGHAQRSTLIAAALGAGTDVRFAAFPGCMGLVKARGFDVMPLVSRSAQHLLPYENDLPNYLRLRALAADAAGIVFDGGYVFDSVYRTVIEGGMPGIWIRRGLWQTGQDNTVALDREKAFARVVVPGEAFPELDRAYSRGDHVVPVGPVVAPRAPEPEARAALRAALAERFGIRFDRLVISLLGAGVAADRGAQIQALCGMAERRADILHLVVVWPSAVLQPAWFGWRRSRIVKTLDAGALAAAADLLVSAAGYNTFLEVLYGRMPAIFIPQMGPFMDDQRSRAQAAVERGLAALVEPTDLLALDRMVARMLEGEAEAVRARLAAADLPEPGTDRAAALIAEVLA